jgi:hypothetical protein
MSVGMRRTPVAHRRSSASRCAVAGWPQEYRDAIAWPALLGALALVLLATVG